MVCEHCNRTASRSPLRALVASTVTSPLSEKETCGVSISGSSMVTITLSRLCDHSTRMPGGTRVCARVSVDEGSPSEAGVDAAIRTQPRLKAVGLLLADTCLLSSARYIILYYMCVSSLILGYLLWRCIFDFEGLLADLCPLSNAGGWVVPVQ